MKGLLSLNLDFFAVICLKGLGISFRFRQLIIDYMESQLLIIRTEQIAGLFRILKHFKTITRDNRFHANEFIWYKDNKLSNERMVNLFYWSKDNNIVSFYKLLIMSAL